ncbi:hypothetical protein GQ53DRAFT_290555 [Thozetella sp. PMI_491]|nr:hypothetical protein GQ53DRAFT_290555 [Thozetella sp. PMI_491]
MLLSICVYKVGEELVSGKLLPTRKQLVLSRSRPAAGLLRLACLLASSGPLTSSSPSFALALSQLPQLCPPMALWPSIPAMHPPAVVVSGDPDQGLGPSLETTLWLSLCMPGAIKGFPSGQAYGQQKKCDASAFWIICIVPAPRGANCRDSRRRLPSNGGVLDSGCRRRAPKSSKCHSYGGVHDRSFWGCCPARGEHLASQVALPRPSRDNLDSEAANTPGQATTSVPITGGTPQQEPSPPPPPPPQPPPAQPQALPRTTESATIPCIKVAHSQGVGLEDAASSTSQPSETQFQDSLLEEPNFKPGEQDYSWLPPGSEIPGIREPDSYWEWDEMRLRFRHRDDKTGRLIWCPDSFD